MNKYAEIGIVAAVLTGVGIGGYLLAARKPPSSSTSPPITVGSAPSLGNITVTVTETGLPFNLSWGVQLTGYNSSGTPYNVAIIAPVTKVNVSYKLSFSLPVGNYEITPEYVSENGYVYTAQVVSIPITNQSINATLNFSGTPV